jgi:hypothetical protein
VKLNPEDLVVTTFAIDPAASESLPTIGTNGPTPATNCDDCLSPTIQGCW